MSAGRARAIALLAVFAWVGACTFAPDLSRYQACGAGGDCPAGYQCWSSARLCIPSCEDPPLCGAPGPDAGLAIGPDALPPAVELRPYLAELRADGGVPPYSFRELAPLPAGLGLDDAGVLSGVPSDAGPYEVMVRVEDGSVPPLSASATRALPVRALLRMAGPGTLARAAVGQAYTEALSATGGGGGYRFSLADGGALPAGLTLAQDGTVTGSTQDSGVASFDVLVSDGDQPAQSAVRRLTLNVIPLPITLQFATQSMPDGRLGSLYSYRLQRFAGTGQSTWTLTAGAFPPNVGLDTVTGVISGIPSARGKFTFTIELRDSIGAIEATFSIDVL